MKGVRRGVERQHAVRRDLTRGVGGEKQTPDAKVLKELRRTRRERGRMGTSATRMPYLNAANSENIPSSAASSRIDARIAPIVSGVSALPRLMKHAMNPAPSDAIADGHTLGNPAHMS